LAWAGERLEIKIAGSHDLAQPSRSLRTKRFFLSALSAPDLRRIESEQLHIRRLAMDADPVAFDDKNLALLDRRSNRRAAQHHERRQKNGQRPPHHVTSHNPGHGKSSLM
jgi:hypothetical protein